MNPRYELLAEELESQGINIDDVKARLKKQHIETPSWGYGDSGTRFGVFRQASAAQDVHEKLQDAATVHKYTGIAPTVALHIPWDMVDDWQTLPEYAEELGIGIGAINPNLFQDEIYKLGSVCNPDEKIRRQATDHMLECVDIMQMTGSTILSIWVADGTNFPGQGDFRKRKNWLCECFAEVYDALPENARMLIEYKFFEPSFYHTDLADWGSAYVMATTLGNKAQVLIDLGHHAQGTNIEYIVAWLIDEGKLGGFHFNSRKYADDDLTVGSMNPQELFFIYNELVTAELDENTETDIAFMIDQSHNLKEKIEASIQSVCNLQQSYAKSLIVNRPALDEAQDAGMIIDAEEILKRAYNTDVRPLLEQVRTEMGRDPNPRAAFCGSGYMDKVKSLRTERSNRKSGLT